MKKVYRFEEERPNGYSEQWKATYRIEIDGFFVKKEQLYCTFSKGEGAWKAVVSKFHKDFPTAELIRVQYQ